MKSLFSAGLLLLTAFTLLTSSCEKEEDEMIPPSISFKTGGAYTSTSTTATKNASVTIGINAAKTEDEDVLTLFNITRSYDGGAPTTVYSQALSGTSGDNFSYDYAFSTRNSAGTEKYIFTVTNRDGLMASQELTLTVN